MMATLKLNRSHHHAILTLLVVGVFSYINSSCHVSHAFVLVLPSSSRRTSSSASSLGMSSSLSSSSSSSVDQRFGDARGAALLLEDVSVYRGPAQILKNIHWRIEPRTKWALVGANGCGKSTVLKAIVGEIPFDGNIVIGVKKGQQRVGYLQQTAVAGSNLTIYEEAASGMVQINQAREAMERAVASEDVIALETATARFEAAGGYQQEQKVAYVLKGLGFTDFNKRCDTLSGGWQMRVALARLLLSEPAICLMDEPGNHLDAAAKKWLVKYLAAYEGEGSLILVSHDISLLKSMNHIAEIVPDVGSLQVYKSCTYDQFFELKVQRAAAAVAAYEKNAEKAAKLQAFVDRFGASATKASAAQSRVKQIERMEREGLLDVPSQAVIAKRFRPTLVLPDAPKAAGDVLLSLKNAQIGYEGKPLVSNVNLEITKGMKLLIRGPNGAGKSTILHALRGTLPLLQGERKQNPSLRLGTFTQDLAQELNPNARAVDVATAYAREGPDGVISVSEQDARTVMGRLGLQSEKPLRYVRDLSGGERARVCLAMFALKPSNLYLFDEASNHLDIECVECLSSALSTWGNDTGAFVIVSHDRSFCQQIEFTHVATVQDGRFILEQRNAVEGDWVIGGMSAGVLVKGTVSPSTSESTDADVEAFDAKRRKQVWNAPKRIAKLEELIEVLEERIATIDSEMLANGSDIGKLTDLTKEKEELEAQVSVYMDEWEELEELLSLVAVA